MEDLSKDEENEKVYLCEHLEKEHSSGGRGTGVKGMK